MIGRWLLLATLGITTLMTSCGSQKEAAFRAFSETWSCPRDHIIVAAIEGVTMRELFLRANPLPEPPAELRADPERLAVWRKTQDKSYEGVFRGLSQYELFHVSGCGHATDYACYCPPQRKGAAQGSGSRQDFCGCEAPPAPITQGSAS